MSTYSISWKSDHSLLYHENGRTMQVEVEDAYDRPIADPIGPEHVNLWHLIVFTRSIKRWDDETVIDEETRDRIIRNISQALTTTGTRHLVRDIQGTPFVITPIRVRRPPSGSDRSLRCPYAH